jgi:hypothetical protein
MSDGRVLLSLSTKGIIDASKALDALVTEVTAVHDGVIAIVDGMIFPS